VKIRDVLLPVELSTVARAELQRRIGALEPRVAGDVRQGDAGEALALSLLFERWPELAGHDALDPRRRLYTRYFWFRRFTSLWQVANGVDAGLEQQGFQMLEKAEVDLDWALLEEIDRWASAGFLPGGDEE